MPMEESLSWDDLRLVLALAREGSLLGAGRTLGVNASTVGRRLEALEEQLQVQIFDRTRQGVLMTAVAEQMIPFAEAAEQAAADFVRVAEGFEREVEGLVRISAPPGIASLLLAGWVEKWLEMYPKLRIQLDAEVGYVDLSRRESDLAIRAFRPQSGDLIALKWLEGGSSIMASPEYVTKVGEVSELSQLTWISWGPGLMHIPDGMWMMEHLPSAYFALRSDSMEVQVRACSAGLGAMLIAEELASPVGLVPVRLAPSLCKRLKPLPTGALWLVCHRALRHVPRINAIWQALLDSVQSHPKSAGHLLGE